MSTFFIYFLVSRYDRNARPTCDSEEEIIEQRVMEAIAVERTEEGVNVDLKTVTFKNHKDISTIHNETLDNKKTKAPPTTTPSSTTQWN